AHSIAPSRRNRGRARSSCPRPRGSGRSHARPARPPRRRSASYACPRSAGRRCALRRCRGGCIRAPSGVALITFLPFPINLLAVAFEGKSIIDGVVDLFKDAWDYVRTIASGGPLAGAGKGAATGAEVFGAAGAPVGGATLGAV